MSQDTNAEWELLTDIVTAANRNDQESLCALMASPDTDFSDKPRCVQAAIAGFNITPDNVREHSTALKSFFTKTEKMDMDLRTGFRLSMIHQLLHPEPLSPKEPDDAAGL